MIAKYILKLIEDYCIDYNQFSIYVNPSSSEIAKLFKEAMLLTSPFLRFFADNSRKKVYVFDSELLHLDAYSALKDKKISIDLFSSLLKGTVSRVGFTVDTIVEAGYNNPIIYNQDWSWVDGYLHRNISSYVKRRKFKL